MPRSLVVALVATLTLLVATGGGAAPVQAQTAEGRYAQQAFAATNDTRAQKGLPALRLDRCVRRSAVRQATLMAQREQLVHQDLSKVLASCGLNRRARTSPRATARAPRSSTRGG